MNGVPCALIRRCPASLTDVLFSFRDLPPAPPPSTKFGRRRTALIAFNCHTSSSTLLTAQRINGVSLPPGSSTFLVPTAPAVPSRDVISTAAATSPRTRTRRTLHTANDWRLRHRLIVNHVYERSLGGLRPQRCVISHGYHARRRTREQEEGARIPRTVPEICQMPRPPTTCQTQPPANECYRKMHGAPLSEFFSLTRSPRPNSLRLLRCAER